MLRMLWGCVISIAVLGTALADDWGGVSASVTRLDASGLICYPLDGSPSYSPPCALPDILSPTFYNNQSYVGALPSGSSSAQAFLVMRNAQGVVPDSSSPRGWSQIYADIPLSEFARSSSVQALASRVSAVESGLSAIGALASQIGAMSSELSALAAYVPAIQQELQEASWRGSAMAAALDSVGPAAGKRNRLGTNAATINGETAVAVNYVYSGDNVDVSAGIAYSEGEAISKVGVGFSW